MPDEDDRARDIEAARQKAAADAEALKEVEDAKLKALTVKLRDQNETYLTKLGQRLFRFSLAALVLLLILSVVLAVASSMKVVEGRRVLPESPAAFVGGLIARGELLLFAAVAALLIWIVLAALSVAKAKSGRLVSVVIGRDGRLSTSYFQAWVWTIVLAWAFTYFVLVLAVGGIDRLDFGADSGFGISADYLLLLGGPFAALIVAQQVDRSKVASGELQKVTATDTTVTDLFSSDSGRTDLVDTQYLLFNAVAMVFFLGSLVAAPLALPDIPDALILLTSGAALGFIARKAIQGNAPMITSIVPNADAVPTIGRRITISGSNFVPSGGENPEDLSRIRVKFGSVVVAPIMPTRLPTPAEVDELRRNLVVEVPDLSADGATDRTVEVKVITAAGSETPAFTLRVYSAVLRIRVHVDQVDNGTLALRLTLLDRSRRDAPIRLKVGAATYDAIWSGDTVEMKVAKTVVDGQQLSISCGGASHTTFISMPQPG